MHDAPQLLPLRHQSGLPATAPPAAPRRRSAAALALLGPAAAATWLLSGVVAPELAAAERQGGTTQLAATTGTARAAARRGGAPQRSPEPARAESTPPAAAEAAAFAEAVRALQAARAARDETAAALDAAERRAATARAPVEARFAVTLATLRAAVEAARAESEAASRMPEIPPEQSVLLSRRAEAERAIAEAERRLAAATQAQIAAEQARDAAVPRARAAQAELARYEEAIAEISRQRAALLAPGARIREEHVRAAREEDRRLLVLEAEFTPIFEQAKRALRPVLLQRLPALIRLKEQVEALDRYFYCAERRERLEAYFTSAILGLQATVALRGTDASMLSGALVWLGEDSLNNFRETQCSDPASVARVLAQNAQERLTSARLRAEALRTVLARETRAAEEAEATRAQAVKEIAAAQAEIRQARAEIENVNKALTARADEFRAIAGPLAAARQAALEAAGARLDAALTELRAAEAAYAAALSAEVPPTTAEREAAQAAAARAEEAEAAAEAAGDAFAEALAADYARRFVTIASRPAPGWPRPAARGGAPSGGPTALCAEIANTGPLAVRAVVVDLLFRDRSLEAAGIPMGKALGAYGNRGVFEPVVQTQARELLTGLPPRGRWRTEAGECPVIEMARIAEGEPGRALAAGEGGSGALLRNAADWRYAVRAVRLARPETLHRTSDEIWTYGAEPHREVFAAELRQVEEAALAPPSRVAAPEGAPAAPPPVAVAAGAAEDVVAELDRETAERVQRALNARNFNAGTPDGMIGRRTREAIRAFQRSIRQPQTGELTRGQLRRLLAGSG